MEMPSLSHGIFRSVAAPREGARPRRQSAPPPTFYMAFVYVYRSRCVEDGVRGKCRERERGGSVGAARVETNGGGAAAWRREICGERRIERGLVLLGVSLTFGLVLDCEQAVRAPGNSGCRW